MSNKFNESFNDQGETPRFIYKRNPLVAHAFQLFEFKDKKSQYEPIGEYTLINMDEAPDITEKKLMNLLTVMNGKKNLIDFTNLTSERILFNIITETPEETKQKVVFRTYSGDGVSKENAVLEIEKGVFDEEADST